ncbi:MAG TPA: 3-deoxy-8-phosphooctulonate synthase [Planctomycetota bacterium]|jgi:2-dehydro-3-deoxyphosphooctonate aldolase (KDO 8-P synthase)|nr:3-deoxy-8-phosphooctulonate synthase [Planctomycetota bacterium]
MDEHQEARTVEIAGRTFGGGPLFVIAGPCVLESAALTRDLSTSLAEICRARDVPLIFKASFDKANRTSLDAERGPGLERGADWLQEVRERLDLPILTDVHHPEQCAVAAEVADVLQIPAFLCRQTDLLIAAAHTTRAVNIKKGQFLAPWDLEHAARKVVESGNPQVMLTERGTMHGYGRLVVDMTGFRTLAQSGHPVIFDATHSVQAPGALGASTGGDRTLAPALARAAVATGHVDGLFFEVHPDPDSSPSDGPNMLRLDDFPAVLDGILAVRRAVTDTR